MGVPRETCRERPQGRARQDERIAQELERRWFAGRRPASGVAGTGAALAGADRSGVRWGWPLRAVTRKRRDRPGRAPAGPPVRRCAQRGASDFPTVERRRRIRAGLAWRRRAGAARAGRSTCPKGRKYITPIICGPPVGSLRPEGGLQIIPKALCKVRRQARAVTDRSRHASPALARTVELRRFLLRPGPVRPFSPTRSNSGATDRAPSARARRHDVPAVESDRAPSPHEKSLFDIDRISSCTSLDIA